jgi:hypothetical protein
VSFTVGLLELLGYLVPGATVAGVAALVLDARGLSAYFATGFGSLCFLLVSYITGHVLTVVSRLLTDTRDALVKRGFLSYKPLERRYPFYPRLKAQLDHVFSGDLHGEEFQLARVLVAERCPRSSDRIDRYFALVLLTRNMAVACLAAGVTVAWARHWGWGGLFLVSALLFGWQHFRFHQTFRDAVFRAAFVAVSLVRMPGHHRSTDRDEPRAL